MARQLSAILSDLNNVYNPQRDVIKQQQAQLDPMMEAENKGLDAAKQDAFSQITDQSNRRGLFYSGIPIAEEQKYTGSTYLPAVANLRSKYAQQRFNLQDSLNNIDLEQRKYGQSLYDNEVALDLQRESAAAASRAAGAGGGWSPSMGGGQVMGAQSSGYGMMKKPGGTGFAFVGPDGRPVSAATYSAASGIPFRELLSQMAKQGDTGAQRALGFVGGDYGYDPTKINQAAPYKVNNKSIYDNLTWGFNVKNAPGLAMSNGKVPSISQVNSATAFRNPILGGR